VEVAYVKVAHVAAYECRYAGTRGQVINALPGRMGQETPLDEILNRLAVFEPARLPAFSPHPNAQHDQHSRSPLKELNARGSIRCASRTARGAIVTLNDNALSREHEAIVCGRRTSRVRTIPQGGECMMHGTISTLEGRTCVVSAGRGAIRCLSRSTTGALLAGRALPFALAGVCQSAGRLSDDVWPRREVWRGAP
jgi:hypothetical protein